MKKIIALIGMVAFVGLSSSGCMVMKSDFEAQQRQVAQLQLEVKDLRDKQRVSTMELTRAIGGSKGSSAEIAALLSQMRSDLQEVMDGIDSMEKKLAPEGREFTFKNFLDYTNARLDRIEARLRLKPLDPVIVQAEESTAGPEPFAINVDDTDPLAIEYAKAADLYKQDKFQEAFDMFKQFVADYPDAEKAPEAQVFAAECMYKMEKYEEAILECQNLIDTYSKSKFVPQALLRQGFAFLNLGDETSAKLLFNKLVKEHRRTYEAKIAKEKLQTMR